MFQVLIKKKLILFLIIFGRMAFSQTNSENNSINDSMNDIEFIDKLETELNKHQTQPEKKIEDSNVAPKKRVIRRVQQKEYGSGTSSTSMPSAQPTPVQPIASKPQLYVPEPRVEVKKPNNRELEKSLRDTDSQYGRYRLSLGVSTLSFSDSQFSNLYKKIYEDTSYYPKLSVSWIPIDSVVGLGIKWSVGYYSDTGKAPDKDSTIDNITLTDTKIRFKMYPNFER